MQNRFDNNDFEHFLKENADQYRMFPSEKVWKGIHNTLHTRRRWYGIGLGLLLLTTGVVTWVMLLPNGKKQPVADSLPIVTIPASVSTITEKTPAINRSPVLAAKPSGSKPRYTESTVVLDEQLFAGASSTDISAIENKEIVKNNTIETQDDAPFIDAPKAVAKVEPVYQPESIVKNSPANHQIAAQRSAKSNVVPQQPVNQYSFIAAAKTEVKQPAPIIKAEETMPAPEKDIYPYTIESVVNSYTRVNKRKRVSWQAYITPTITYRELNENKPFINYARNAQNGAQVAYYTVDINKVVTHKPDLGMQIGVVAGYPLSKKLKLVGGLQFNVSKYDIKAFSGTSEVATITLNGSGNNTVTTISNYRSTGGTARANWLHNLYFSASAPIGLELKLAGNRKSQVGITGTIQPTYILSDQAYVISTDYKNYVEVPSLTRRWNLNTGFEVFASHTTGNVTWRVGPQVRYQTMSSFQDKYPVKEHLFDFGLKLGVMLKK